MPSERPPDLSVPTFLLEEPVTWAGAFPGGKEFCFATESGSLHRMRYDLQSRGPTLKVIESGEPINGVAFTKDLMALSTPAEVVIRKLSRDVSRTGQEFLFPGGGHGIIASEEGRVLAPMGRAGLLLIQPLQNGQHARTTIKAQGQSPYCYRTVQVGKDHQGAELFASAGRTDGVILTPIGHHREAEEITILRPGDASLSTVLDVVDLCSLNLPGYPRSLAVLGIDGSIHLSVDILERSIVTMKIPGIKGTAYSIHCAQGILFILTSQKLYMAQGVVDRLFTKDRFDQSWPIRHLDLDPVGCTIVDNEHLLIILEDRITVTKVSLLQARGGPFSRRDEANGTIESKPGQSNDLMVASPGYPTEISTEIMAFV